MRLFCRLGLLTPLLLLSACTKNRPAIDEQADPRALKPGDWKAESRSHLGQASVGPDVWSYDVPFWNRDGFSVIVAHVNWKGRKETGPVFVLLTRHPLPKTLDEASMGQFGENRVDSKDFPDDLMHLSGSLKNGLTQIGYRFVVRNKDLTEEFTLYAGKRDDDKGKPYKLADGRLFLVDATTEPPRVEQLTDVKDVSTEKDSCVALLKKLAPKSEVAKSLLEEVQRR